MLWGRTWVRNPLSCCREGRAKNCGFLGTPTAKMCAHFSQRWALLNSVAWDSCREKMRNSILWLLASVRSFSDLTKSGFCDTSPSLWHARGAAELFRQSLPNRKRGLARSCSLAPPQGLLARRKSGRPVRRMAGHTAKFPQCGTDCAVQVVFCSTVRSRAL